MRNGNSLGPRCAPIFIKISAFIMIGLICSQAAAAPPQGKERSEIALLKEEVAGLQKQMRGYNALRREVARLRNRRDRARRDREEQKELSVLIAHLSSSIKNDAKHDDGYTAGYDDGFYLQSPHQSNKLVINGELQFRYMYTHSEGFSSPGPTDSPSAGDTNGFSFRRARLTFSGNVISRHLLYNIQGDFAGDSSNNGNFQLNNLWMAWQLNSMIGFRLGAFAVPFSKVQWWENEYAFDFQETPEELVPFDPDHSLGISAFGDLINNKIGYEVMLNDGSQANETGYSSAINGAQDNRLGIYGRVQWAAAGHETDFLNEPDYQYRRHFIWMLGAAFGYESQNATSTAFPSPQNTLLAQGLSAGSPSAFLAPIAFTGNLYRATADWSAKYRGLSLNSAVYFQQFNDTLPPGPTNTFQVQTGAESTYQIGYFVQAGYFIVPRRWQLTARVGQIVSSGPKHMDIYSVGLNYYLLGYHASILSDITYVPDAGYTDPQTGTFLNSRDIIYKMQFQLLF